MIGNLGYRLSLVKRRNLAQHHRPSDYLHFEDDTGFPSELPKPTTNLL